MYSIFFLATIFVGSFLSITGKSRSRHFQGQETELIRAFVIPESLFLISAAVFSLAFTFSSTHKTFLDFLHAPNAKL